MNAENVRPICLVENDDDVRASAKLLLESAGYAVRDYASAEAVLADAAAPDAACLLLDFQLGGMTGLELLERLQARGIKTPAILLTATGNAVDARYRAAKVLTVLRKPVAADELLGWIAKACAQS